MSQPLVITEIAAAREVIWRERSLGQRVGLVPTMGALHAGHLSLAAAAQQQCDRVVVTIFVNPTQFGPQEDLARYPRPWDDDLARLRDQHVDYLFAPTESTVYPPGCSTRVEPSAVGTDLEGRCRPGHFRGVATVVLKLFQMLPAQHAFFGEKDYQQCLVIRDLVRDLNVPIGLTFCPTVREPDGLALSSRNRYLQPAERQRALAISRGLAWAAQQVAQGEQDAGRLEREVTEQLLQAGLERIDYVAVRDPETLAPISDLHGAAIMLIAAHVGTTRLIDNRRLHRHANSPHRNGLPAGPHNP